MATKSDSAANGLKHGYEASVKARALARAGACNNLNGHILEIMGADKTNLNPLNIVRGVHEKLTSSPTAKVVDSVVMKGGKVISRVQYKDTPKGIADTIRRVKSGQYDTATLKGTTETARKFNAAAEKAGITKRMQDTGISGKTTKSLARSCGACKQVPLSKAVAWSAKSGGMWGGAVSGGISAVTNVIAVCNVRKMVGKLRAALSKTRPVVPCRVPERQLPLPPQVALSRLALPAPRWPGRRLGPPAWWARRLWRPWASGTPSRRSGRGSSIDGAI